VSEYPSLTHETSLKSEVKHSLCARRSYEQQWLKAFLEEIGVRVVCTDQRLWHSDGCRLFLPLPCKDAFALPQEERSRLWHSGAIFLRYPCCEDVPGHPSHIYLVDDKDYDFHSLLGNQRKETGRALRKCNVERIPIEYLFREGFDLIRDTYDRQGRACTDEVIEDWERYFRAAAQNPIFEAWGAFVGGELAAYRVDFTFFGGFYGEALFNRRDLLKYQVMNALMFVSTREAMRREEIDHVSYGLRGLTGESQTLNRFKESLGYRKVAVAERIAVRPALKPMLDAGLIHLFRVFLSRWCKGTAKAERICGMIDTYLNQRKDPLGTQI